MSDLFVPRVGGVLSADIAVPEHERALRFYARVLSLLLRLRRHRADA